MYMEWSKFIYVLIKHGFIYCEAHMKHLSNDNLASLEMFLFLFFFALFGWPIITIVDRTHDSSIFIYLFLVWGIVILLIALISLSLKPSHSSHGTNEESGEG